jgi:hypothetical protein
LEPAAASVAAAVASGVPGATVAGAATLPVAVDDATARVAEVVIIVVVELEAVAPACDRDLTNSHPPIPRSARRVTATISRVPPAPDVRVRVPA